MSKWKLLFMIVILAGVVLAGYRYLDQNILGVSTVNIVEDDACTVADNITWCQSENQSLNIAIFEQPLEFLFTDENAQKLSEQALLNELVLAVNGSYFRGSFISSQHAGLLQIKGEVFELMAADNQLTHVLIYDHERDELVARATKDFDPEDFSAEKYTLVQTGPLMVDQNQVQDKLIADSANGSGRYLRAVIGFTESGKKFLLVTTVNYTLGDLAKEIVAMPIFAGEKLTVVNLDGGTSTAMYSEELEQFRFGESKRLPLVIGVK